MIFIKHLKYLFIFIFVLSEYSLMAQINAINTGVMYITPGTLVDAEGSFTTSGAGSSENGGDFYVKGDWVNNGTYVTNVGTVYLRGSVQQNISGTSQTDYYNLDINKPSNGVTLNVNSRAVNSLTLTTGPVDLNGYTMRISNTATTAITYTNGYIISERTDNSSKVKWTMNSTTGSHIVPFGTTGGIVIPLTLNLTAGNIGDMTVSTYHTAANNLPMPITPDTVYSIVDFSGNDNSANMVDRYWQIDKSGAGGTITATFTYTNAEVPANGEVTMNSQRYNPVTHRWELPLAGQTQNAVSNTVTTPGITSFGAHTLVLNSNLLPLELVEFNAVLQNDKVKISWTTASEINSDYFTIQRSIDGINFQDLKIVPAAGNSRNWLEYFTYDENPLIGKSYYRLKETDFDNSFTYCGVREIYYENTQHLQVTIYPNPSHGEVNLLITKEENGKASVNVFDRMGRLVYSRDIKLSKGENTSSFNFENLARGLYFIRVELDGKNTIEKSVVLE